MNWVHNLWQNYFTSQPIIFAEPLVLLLLLLLPLLWWLVRATPPAPQRLIFPAWRLVADLSPQRHVPTQTPWWLLLLRLLLVSTLIFALARPILHHDTPLPGNNPLLVVINNSWSSAQKWPEKIDKIENLLRAAARTDRPVYLLPLAASGPETATTIAPLTAQQALAMVQQMQPQPWLTDVASLIPALENIPDVTTVLFRSPAGMDDAMRLLSLLQKKGEVFVHTDDAQIQWLTHAEQHNEGLLLNVQRLYNNKAENFTLLARDKSSREIMRSDGSFAAGESETTALLRLPAHLRHDARQVEIIGATHAGGVYYFDLRTQRPLVGIIAPPTQTQPLLAESYYISKALTGLAETRSGSVAELLAAKAGLLVQTDSASLTADDYTALTEFVKKGGVLIKFAGTQTAANAANDPLLPVRLTGRVRDLQGALSWGEPLAIGHFTASSPLAGLVAPPELRIRRQTLADPSDPALSSRVWASLSDGTPLITARNKDLGMLVMVHLAATPNWSDLPLAGLFIQLWPRLLDLSMGQHAPSPEQMQSPYLLIDGTGQLRRPQGWEPPLSANSQEPPSPKAPPGLYGVNEQPSFARNLGEALALSKTITRQPAPLPDSVEVYNPITQELDLRPWLLWLGLCLLLLDGALALLLTGQWTAYKGSAYKGAASKKTMLLLLLLCWPHEAMASNNARATAALASSNTLLGYVVTGDSTTDNKSQAGLKALAQAITARTSVSAVQVVPIRLGQDALPLLSLLYWQMTPTQAPLGNIEAQRLSHYVQQGGMLLLDLATLAPAAPDAVLNLTAAPIMQRVLSSAALPPLSPLPPKHVLLQSFYLLHDCTGRFSGNQIWGVSPDALPEDGVSNIILGSHDWAGGWQEAVQSPSKAGELALRCGVNILLYALTGTYKADQQHLPAILERLQQ